MTLSISGQRKRSSLLPSRFPATLKGWQGNPPLIRSTVPNPVRSLKLSFVTPLISLHLDTGRWDWFVSEIKKKIDELQSVEITQGNQNVTIDGLLSSARIKLIELSKTDANQAGEAIQNAIVGAFSSAEDALIEFVKTGKANFGDFADSIISDLSRIVIQQAITKPAATALEGILGSIQGAVGGAGFSLFGGGASAGGSLLSASSPAGNVSYSAGSSNYTIGSTIGSQGQYTLGGGAFQGLPGFETGGSFTVGGQGGMDSQVVAFRATPGERVSISTPSQNAQGSRSGGTVINMTINTPNAQSFLQSKSQVQNAALQAIRAGSKNS